MSYTVFALKWRPKTFDEVVGQGHIVNTLKSALEKNRLAHAYLFAGPRGIGKTSTARILAKALNCQNGPTANPCGKCNSCLEIAAGRSFDVIEIDGASNNGVENIRDLREGAKFAPSAGRFKVYIIDEVHMLSNAAFNALLKTLEEPPPYVKFIFATTHPDEIIPTVLSRCQRFDFRRISALEISRQLESIVETENIDVDKEVLFAIARASDGSLRDAESILDQLISFSQQKVRLKDVISVLGLVEQDRIFGIVDKIIHNDPAGVLDLLNNIIDEGKDPAVFLNNLIEHFRNLMVSKVAGADSGLIDLPKEICDQLFVQSKSFSMEDLFLAFNVLVNTQEMAKRLDSQRIPLEISLVKLAHPKNAASSGTVTLKHSSADVKNQGSAVKDKPSGINTPTMPPPINPDKINIQNKPSHGTGQTENLSQSSVKNAGGQVSLAEPVVHMTLDQINESWKRIIEILCGIKISVANYLNEGSPLRFEDGVLTVSFPKDCSLHKESLEKKDNREVIEKVFLDVLNVPLRVNFIFSAAKSRPHSPESKVVRSAIDTFNGRLISRDDNVDLY